MAYTFVNGEVATKAKLDQIIGATTLTGITKVTPVANTPTSVYVKFSTPFTTVPRIVLTPQTVVTGTTVRGVSAANQTVAGFDLVVYRTNTTNTYVAWQAWQAPTAFTTGQPATATLLNQGGSGAVAQVGTRAITPVANTPTSQAVTFPTPFLSTPVVVTCSVSTAPGSEVLGTAATEVDESGFRCWITRTNATPSTVAWVALGRL